MDCQNLMTGNISKIPKRNPTDGTFELTVRCNLHCKMCLFRHDDSENKILRDNELTSEQWIDMAKQVANAGTLSLLITGGEPMLRPDFCEIYEGIYKQGFILTLYTNATLVTPKIMDTLRKYPPHKIGVTIYGASSDTYERVCGDASGYEKMLKGIDQLRTLPSVLDFRTTIIKDNYDDMYDIERLVKERFDSTAHVMCTTTVTKAVRGGCSKVAECRLSSCCEHRMHLDRKLRYIKEYIGDDFDINNVGVVEKTQLGPTDNKKGPFLGCHAGLSSYTITNDGNLLPCQMFDYFSLNAKSLSFKQAWNNLVEDARLPDENKKCLDCDVKDYCEYCYATRYAETGQLNGCNEYMYNHAKELKILESKFERNNEDEKNL